MFLHNFQDFGPLPLRVVLWPIGCFKLIEFFHWLLVFNNHNSLIFYATLSLFHDWVADVFVASVPKLGQQMSPKKRLQVFHNLVRFSNWLHRVGWGTCLSCPMSDCFDTMASTMFTVRTIAVYGYHNEKSSNRTNHDELIFLIYSDGRAHDAEMPHAVLLIQNHHWYY